MKTASLATKPSSAHTTWRPLRSGILQRRCVCGGNPGPGGECAECRRKRRLAEGSLLQPSLKIGRADDPLEREADRVAEEILRMPEPRLQRQPETEREEEELLRPKPLVQRRVTGSETGLAEAPPIVHEVLRSPGRPLDPATRAFFEPRLGYDLSRVRIHTGPKAAEAAEAVGARAFTVGRDVVFGSGAYAPKTCERQKLLAHELIHVVQQNQGILTKHDTETQDSYLKIQSKIRTNIVQRFVGSFPLGAEEAGRQLAARQLTRRAAPRVLWRHFWRAVIRRFALRGATAAALAAADGPLPIGELIGIGLAIWTIWDIINLREELWEEAEEFAEAERRRRECYKSWVSRGGGDYNHDEYARYVAERHGKPAYANFDYRLGTNGLVAEFDHYNPDWNEFFEAKTRHEFLLREWAKNQPRIVGRLIEQATRQREVLVRCAEPRWRLIWFFDNPDVAEAAKSYLRGIVDEVVHEPWEGQR